MNPVSLVNLIKDVNSPEAELVNRKLIEASLTLLENQHDLIPLKRLDTLKIACLAVGETTATPFQSMLSKYTKTDNFYLPEQFSEEELNDVKTKLQDYNLIIAGLHLYESKTMQSLQVDSIQKDRPKRPYGLSNETRITSYNVCYTKLLRIKVTGC